MIEKNFIFILGPTASGKSRLAERLCREYRLPLLNADSVQAYQRIAIGAAKPTAEELLGIEHYLWDFVAPPDQLTAGQFLAKTEEVVRQLRDRSALVFAGGSGFYVRALEKGMPDIPPSDPQLQAVLKQELHDQGEERLYQELLRVDPVSAGKISPRDHYRLLRFLEIFRASGKAYSELNQPSLDKFNLSKEGKINKIWLQIERSLLRERVDQRVEKMIKAGLVEEVQSLLDQGLKAWAPLKSIGYIEVVKALSEGSLDKERLKEEIVQNTMLLAKKQQTWWRRDAQLFRLDATLPFDQIYDQAIRHIQSQNVDPLSVRRGE